MSKTLWFATLTAVCSEATTNYAVFDEPQNLATSMQSLLHDLKSSSEMSRISVDRVIPIETNKVFYFSGEYDTMIGMLIPMPSARYLLLINHAPIVHHNYSTGVVTRAGFDMGSWFDVSLNDIVCEEECKSITAYSANLWNHELNEKMKFQPALFMLLQDFVRHAKSLFACLQSLQ